MRRLVKEDRPGIPSLVQSLEKGYKEYLHDTWGVQAMEKVLAKLRARAGAPSSTTPKSLNSASFSVKEAEFKDLGVFQICKRRWRPSVIKRPIRCCSIFEEN